MTKSLLLVALTFMVLPLFVNAQEIYVGEGSYRFTHSYFKPDEKGELTPRGETSARVTVKAMGADGNAEQQSRFVYTIDQISLPEHVGKIDASPFSFIVHRVESGAIVRVEPPAPVELIDPARRQLVAGMVQQLVVTVSPSMEVSPFVGYGWQELTLSPEVFSEPDAAFLQRGLVEQRVQWRLAEHIARQKLQVFVGVVDGRENAREIAIVTVDSSQSLVRRVLRSQHFIKSESANQISLVNVFEFEREVEESS